MMSLRNPANREQCIIFPVLMADIVERIPHAARFFLYLAGELKLKLYKQFFIGTPRYNRPTLVAVILYAMYKGYYGADSIVQYANDSIGTQWILNGMKMPSYKTVERTICSILNELDEIFSQVLVLCMKQDLIGGGGIYIDGVKVQANASKHKAMSYEYLQKKITGGKKDLKTLLEAFKEAMDVNELENWNDLKADIMEDAENVHNGLQKIHQDELDARQEQVFNKDTDSILDKSLQSNEKTEEIEKLKNEVKIFNVIEPEKQDGAFKLLNDIAFVNQRVVRMEEAKTELENKWKADNGNKKIPGTQQINFTDSDSGIMQTKHHGVQQCYNNFALVDNKANIILGSYTYNNASDQLGLIPCVENAEKTYGCLRGYQFGADAGFFSAKNISFTIDKGIDFYASYPEPKNPYAKDKFKYDESSDTYICPEKKTLSVEYESADGIKRQYCNEVACIKCKYSKECTQAKDGVRRIERDMVDDKLREDARVKANSAEGKEILRLRKSIPEPVWGNIKIQDGFVQMHFRGMEKAGREFMLHCLMQNMRKLFKVYECSRSYQEVIHNKSLGCMKVA